jgi:outer membrane lipoprotein LolB
MAQAILLAAALCSLSACQGLAPSAPLAGAQFAGRLGVKVDGDDQRSFSATFELRGDASNGWMALSNPLGTQIGSRFVC